LRRIPAVVFAGDSRVWRAALLAAVPVVLLIGFYSLRPVAYYTGTDSVEAYTYIVETPAGEPVCVPDLRIPAGTARVRLSLISRTRVRPALRMALTLAGPHPRVIESQLGPTAVPANRISGADFAIPQLPATESASLCLTAADLVNWGGTPFPAVPSSPPTAGGHPLAGRIAVWYLPRSGAKRSYVAGLGEILRRAALFRPGIVGGWTYVVILFLLLPAIALLAVRCLALAVAGRGRRLGAWLFAIAGVNACCWALITPVFQGPDEVDHFAYVQSLVERGEGPSHDPNSPLPRWSDSESRALEDMSFFSDHQVGNTKPPWLSSQQQRYEADVAALHPKQDNGGGYSTSAAHGPLYYLALAPAYALTKHGSVFSQLTLMRLTSALLGALVALFTFLLARELAPGRPWLAVLAALLVAFQPMYGFVSGIVNNDVGVNAGAAAVELLLIRMLRRGITIPWGLLTGAVLLAVPNIKGTGLSLYPVAALVFAATLWRRHGRRDLYAWAALALGAIVVGELSAHVLSDLQPAASATGSATISSNASAVSEALHHIPDFVVYLWQAVLPRLPFMAHYFPPAVHGGFILFRDPGFTIFVERGWGAFGWYDVFFRKWVYVVIFLAIVMAVPLGAVAARREWGWVGRHRLELIALIAMPACVIVGFEAAYFTTAPRTAIAEFGRYVFPAIGPLAVLVVGGLHAFGRGRMLPVGVVLLVGMIGLGYASQLLTLTSFYA
jgi:Dolichyl-phosphate-mannose-protein mannosyltransferase